MPGSWRDSARPIIAAVVQQVGLHDRDELRRALHAAYPWGERRRWPYKSWLAEIKAQIGGLRPRRQRGTGDLFDG